MHASADFVELKVYANKSAAIGVLVAKPSKIPEKLTEKLVYKFTIWSVVTANKNK